MKFDKVYDLADIAAIISSDFVGDASFPVHGMNEIHVVTPGDIVFVDHPKYYDKALNSAATIILINKKVDAPEGKALLISDDPFRDFNILTRTLCPGYAFAKAEFQPTTIASTAFVHAQAVIGEGVVIGEHSVIHANAVIGNRCILGNNVIVHAGTVLGGDAFYYKKRETGYDKLLSNGRVVVEDHVEIGTLCTIDRGVTGDTTIGHGSKIDNQVHIGHDTVIGAHVLIASQTGIAGCVVIEDDVKIWGQVGIRSDIRIGKGSEVYAQSGISKSLEPGSTVWGSPAGDAREKMKEMAAVRQLPNFLRKD